jgi:hypothetical protein
VQKPQPIKKGQSVDDVVKEMQKKGPTPDAVKPTKYYKGSKFEKVELSKDPEKREPGEAMRGF